MLRTDVGVFNPRNYDKLIDKYKAKNLTRVFREILCKTATHPERWDTNNFGAGIVNAADLLSDPLLSLQELFPEKIELVAEEVEDLESFEEQVCYAFSEQGFNPDKIDSEFIQRYGNEILFLDLYRLQRNKFTENTPEMSVALKSALDSNFTPDHPIANRALASCKLL